MGQSLILQILIGKDAWGKWDKKIKVCQQPAEEKGLAINYLRSPIQFLRTYGN